MEILGIGPSELFFVIVIALIVLGPKDMQKAGKTVGRWLNNLLKSDGWKAFQQTSKEIRTLPTKLMRDANMEIMEVEKDIHRAMNVQPNRSASTPDENLPHPQQAENSIQPPSIKSTEPDSDPHDKTS